MADFRHWSLVGPARVIFGPLQNHSVEGGGVATSFWEEEFGIGCCDESFPEAVQSPACLDPLLDDKFLWAEGEALTLGAQDVELEKCLAFSLDLAIVLAKANPELERVSF